MKKKNVIGRRICALIIAVCALLIFQAVLSNAEDIRLISFGDSSAFISTDKPSYSLGEIVTITSTLSEQQLNSLKTQIVSPSNTYVLMDWAGQSANFVPRELGMHFVQLISLDGSIISSAAFDVNVTKNQIPENPKIEFPSQQKNASIIARNSRGIAQQIISQNYNPISRRLSISFSSLAVSEIDFDNISQSPAELRIEDVPSSDVENFSGKAVRSFAIDPTSVNFTSADVYFTAAGDELWKCRDYDFYSRKCMGRYEKILDTIPGNQYILTLTKEDPLYTEVWNNLTCTCQNTGPDNGWAYCEVFCQINVPVPKNATDGYLSVVGYNVSITTSYSAGGGITSGSGRHYSFFDRDQTKANSNESFIGVIAYDGPGTTTQVIYNSSMSPSGSASFSRENCPTWSSGYCTWYIFLNSTAKSSKTNRPVTVNITLNSINWTWNYTSPTPSNITVNLTSPSDNAALNFRNVNFTYIPVSSTPISNCSLYLNLSGSWAPAALNTSIQNNSVNRINYTFSDEGIYLWNIKCFSGNSSSFAIYNRTITIDTSAPVLNLISPPDGNFSSDSVVTFTYNVTDNFNIANCSLIIDGAAVSTSYSVQKNTPQNITYALSNGVHNWSINCTDQAGNMNASSTRSINVSATPVIWERRWYETSTSSYTSTAGISLSNTRDSTENNVVVSVPPSNSYTLVNALSPYISSNGAFIPAGTNVSFSSEFSTSPANKGLVSWFLYKTDGLTDTLLCNYGDGGSGGYAVSSTSTGLCTISSDTRLLPTEMLKLVIIVYNNFGNAVTFTHTWDNLRLSYVEFSSFITLGTLSVELTAPASNLTIGQNELFNQSCNVSCYGGTCLNTNVYAQYNTSSLSWTAIGSSGNLILNTGETNPHSIGTVNNSNITTFSVKGNTASSNNIRCIAVSSYSNATGTITMMITIGDTTPPTVTLGNPANYSWQNNATVVIYYTPSDNSAVASCSLYLNGQLNKTDSPIQNGIQQNFTLVGLSEGLYNWTVNCTDDSGNNAQPAVKWFYIDKTKPDIWLNLPPEFSVESQNLIFFNFTAADNMALNLSCNLTIDNVIRRAYINASNATPTVANYTLSLGMHYWNISCADDAGNINTSETRSFNITNTPPSVSLVFPTEAYWDSSGNITFRFNASDNNMLFNCSLIINSAINQSKNSSELINGGENNFTLYEIASGAYSWTVNCTDDDSLTTSAGPITIHVDKSIPSVELISPANYLNSTSSSISLQFRATDLNSPNLSCNLTIDSSLNQSGIAAVNNSVVSNTISFLDGSHSWNVSCIDLAGNYNYSETRSINVSALPSVSLTSPASNAWTNGNITFLFTASDNDGLFNCSLLINGAVNQTKNSSQLVNGGQNNFTLNDIPQGTNKAWTVLCYDLGDYSNYYQPATRLFSVDRTAPFIALNAPASNLTISSNEVMLYFNATDNYAANLLCNVTVNNNVEYENLSVQSGVQKNASLSDLGDGIYYWNVSCTDAVKNLGISATWNFTILLPPAVTLFAPDNNTWQNSSSIAFSYYVVDDSAVSNCSLYIDGSLNQTNDSITNDAYNYFYAGGLSEGNHTWNVSCSDPSANIGASPVWIFGVDTHAPWIEQHSPQNNTIWTSNYVTFNWTAFDNLAQNLNCSLYVDNNLKESGIIAQNGTSINRTYIYSDSIYFWNVTCLDLAHNINASELWNFTVKAPPNVTLESPGNNSWGISQDLTFTYLPEDPIGIRQCVLYIDGQQNATDTNIEANTNNSFYVTGIPEGAHTWTVNCTDSDWNTYAPPQYAFYIDRSAPAISITMPSENQNFSVSQAVLNFTATDNLAPNLTCNITINSIFNRTVTAFNNTPYNFTLTGLSDGTYSFNVSCTDLAGNSNNSELRHFNVSVSPNISLVSPADFSWRSANPVVFYFNASDNDGLLNCSLLINGSVNTTKSSGLLNNGQNNISATLGEGIFSWAIKCFDSGAYSNSAVSSSRIIYVDLFSPSVTLLLPDNGATLSNNSPLLNFTASDNVSQNITCNLTMDSIIKDSYINLSSGAVYSKEFSNLTSGLHFWNVSCADYVGHIGTSATWNFTVPKPDLTLNSSDISFYYNTTNPEEGKAVTINATIHNFGASPAINFTVQFFDGDPSSGGLQIGQNRTLSLSPDLHSTLSANWTASLGMHNIFIIVDPPLASNGSISEENESNNYANQTILIQSWQYVYGNLSGGLGLGSQFASYVYLWNLSDANGSNIFVADSDSSINWSSLSAIGRTTSGEPSPDDFAAIDSALSMSAFFDSVNSTYASGGEPVKVENFTVYGKNIENVPVANSTNNSNFETGILWDYSDGNTYYNATQDLVFVTKANSQVQGRFGTYDYEMRIPSNLKDYRGSTPSVSLYLELK